MKKIAIVAVAVVMMMGLAGSAMAANSLAQGEKAISVGMGDSYFVHSIAPLSNAYLNNVVDISGRYFLAKDVALYGGFGLQLNSGDYDGTYFSFTVGARKYLSVNDFAPFVAAQLHYITVNADGPNGVKIADASVFDLAALFGAEYFFSKSFSVEGAIGVGLGQYSSDLPVAAGGGDSTYFGTRTVGVHVNFYF
jgi:hypothetical protein